MKNVHFIGLQTETFFYYYYFISFELFRKVVIFRALIAFPRFVNHNFTFTLTLSNFHEHNKKICYRKFAPFHTV